MPTLLTIFFHLEDFDHYGIRNIVLNDEKNITKTNILFYYKNFIGLQYDYIYTFENSIPDSFNMELLGKCGNPNKIYPVYDILIEKGKIEHYKLFVTNVIATENSRLSLLSDSSSSFFEKPAWLIEIENFYNVNKLDDNSINSINSINYQGIIIAPVHKFTRESKGFKFLTKKEDIVLWKSLLGTYSFPDFMIVRKYNILNWAFVNKSSEKMLNSLFYWFASSYGCKTHYSFIPANIDQLDTLINSFKHIGFTFIDNSESDFIEHTYDEEETFAKPTKPDIFPIHDPLKLACAQIEELMLANSSICDPETLVLFTNKSIFDSYIYQLLSDLNIPFIPENEYLVSECERWFRDKWGVRKEKLEIATKTDEIFQQIIEFHTYCEKALEVWLMYREGTNYPESLTHQRKCTIVGEFVRIAMSKCKKTGDERRIRSKEVYAYLHKYILKILPRRHFEKTLAANNLHSMVTSAGVRSILTVQTRNFVGILLPSQKEHVKSPLDEFLEHVD